MLFINMHCSVAKRLLKFERQMIVFMAVECGGWHVLRTISMRVQHVYGLRKATKNRRIGYGTIGLLPNSVPGVYLGTHVLIDSEREQFSAGGQYLKRALVCWAPIRATLIVWTSFCPRPLLYEDSFQY
jgi:hypothetical protein